MPCLVDVPGKTALFLREGGSGGEGSWRGDWEWEERGDCGGDVIYEKIYDVIYEKRIKINMLLHSFIFGKKELPPSFRFIFLYIKILDFGNKKIS